MGICPSVRGLKRQELTMNDDTPQTFWLDPEDIEAINSSLINNRNYMDSSDTQGTIKSILLELGTYEARVTQNPTAVKMVQNVHFPLHRTGLRCPYTSLTKKLFTSWIMFLFR